MLIPIKCNRTKATEKLWEPENLQVVTKRTQF